MTPVGTAARGVSGSGRCAFMKRFEKDCGPNILGEGTARVVDAGPGTILQRSGTTMKHKALLGLFSGVLLVVGTLIGVAVLNAPAAQGADSASPRAACLHPAAGSEQGYGVQSTHDCPPAR